MVDAQSRPLPPHLDCARRTRVLPGEKSHIVQLCTQPGHPCDGPSRRPSSPPQESRHDVPSKCSRGHSKNHQACQYPSESRGISILPIDPVNTMSSRACSGPLSEIPYTQGPQCAAAVSAMGREPEGPAAMRPGRRTGQGPGRTGGPAGKRRTLAEEMLGRRRPRAAGPLGSELEKRPPRVGARAGQRTDRFFAVAGGNQG